MNDSTAETDDFELTENINTPRPGSGKTRLRIVMARWWLLLIFGLLGYVIALYTLSIAEPSHKARATLEVVTKERRLVGADLEREKSGMAEMMTTLANKLVGPSQLTKVVQSPKIQAIEKAVPPPFSFKPKYWRSKQELSYRSAAEASTSEVVGMITNNLQISPRQGTSLIDITVTHKDPTTALTIADAIMEEYLQSEEQRKSGGATEAYKILRDEAAESAAELETARRAIDAYQGVLATNVRMLAQKNALAQIKQRYKAKHPKMITATASYNDLRIQFRQQIASVLSTPSELEFWTQYRAEMKQYETVINSINDESSPEDVKRAMAAEMNWINLVQRALSSRVGLLQSRVNTKQAMYDTITKRIQEIDVAEENDEGEIRVLEAAYPSGNVEVDKYKRLGQGIGGGIIAGIAVAFLLSMMDYKVYDVRTTEEALGLPCLAAIPQGDVFDIADEWVNVLDANPHSTNAEAIRNLRASVMLLGKAERHKRLLITSAVPGEGKTTVAAELAAAFALSGQKTILIDMDLRKPRVHTLFPGTEDAQGIADVLSGQQELAKVVQKSNVKNLHVIPAGKKAPNPAEILQENEVGSLLSKLSAYYDRVIIDTPPILPVSDTRLLASHAQSVLMVVRAHKAPVGAIMRAKQLLTQSGASLAGVVVNGIKYKHMSSSNYYGYDGYGEYGGYGGYYGEREKKK